MGRTSRDGDGSGANGNGNGVNGSTNRHGSGGNARRTSSLSASNEYISEHELENLKQQFSLLDADGSGSLDHEEFIQLGRKAGLPLEKLETLILLVDKNQVRGTLSVQGYLAHGTLAPLGFFPLPILRTRGWC